MTTEPIPYLTLRERCLLVASGLIKYPPLKTPAQTAELVRRVKSADCKRRHKLKAVEGNLP